MIEFDEIELLALLDFNEKLSDVSVGIYYFEFKRQDNFELGLSFNVYSQDFFIRRKKPLPQVVEEAEVRP